VSSQSTDATPEPQRHIGYLIRRAQQRHVAVWLDEVSSETTSVQYAAMAVLERTPGMSQRELGDELDLDRSTINDLVLRLEKRGLIERAQASDDKRRKVLELTPAGKREFTSLQPAVARVQEILTGDLTASDTAHLREILTALLGGKP
jgi:DNA-binding MarR family transcriptional regulator